MINAYVFPGQGAQFTGMGKDLYEQSKEAKALFLQANEILGFDIAKIMFEGTEDELKQTRVTQPAIFLHSVAMAVSLGHSFNPQMVAGHSLGEFSALTAAGSLSFADGLTLVYKRALSMQKACEQNPSTMAAIIGLDNDVVEQVCNDIHEVVVPANYNTIGQVVISGSHKGIELAMEKLLERGAKRALKLTVGGAFHSPFMEPAREELAKAIQEAPISKPRCPIYQNVDALPRTNPDEIRRNLVSQLTSPVLWTQTIQNMISDGATHFTEVGPGKVLQGLIKKVDRNSIVNSAGSEN